MTPSAFKPIYDAHREHWSSRTDELQGDLNLYRNGGEGTPVPIAFQMIESLVGSLFLRSPSVIGVPGVYGEGSPELAAACANEILRKSNASIENAVKSALVFPGAYLVVVPVKARNPMDRVRVLPAHAWRVIRDADALDWGSSRYIGLLTEIPLDQALADYSGTNVGEWMPHPKTETWDVSSNGLSPADEKYVTVVDVWLPLEGKQVVWSPDFNGDGWVYEGEEIQTGGRVEDQEEQNEAPVEKIDGMLYSSSGSPLVPVIPLNFNPDPLDPQASLSFIGVNRPQLQSLNDVSSAQDMMAKKARRLYMTSPDTLDEASRLALEGGEDSTVLTPQRMGDVPMSETIVPLPLLPVPADVPNYKASLLQDLEKASMMPGFTLGQASKATATEVSQLAAYADTKLGKMASTLAQAVAQAAECAVALLRVMLGDDVEAVSLPRPLGPKLLSAKDLEGDYSFVAVDGANTPASIFQQRQDLERLTPALVQLGVPAPAILEAMVRAYNLPESFLVPLTPSTPAAPTPAQQEVPLDEAQELV
jgi:hypothetical protein